MRLFWKLFLTLLLSLLSIAAASSWLSQRWLLESQQTGQRLDQLAGYAETAANLYVTEGPRALRHWLRHSMRQMHFRGTLLDQHGNNLLGSRPLPPEIQQLIRPAIEQNAALRQVRPPHLLSLVPVATTQGNFYWVAVSLIERDAMQQNRQYALLLRLSMALLLILLVSWMLSRMFTRPIRQLQQSASLLGSGRMHTRAPETLAERGDELGELARSFDSMAVQLEGLMDSHKQLLRDVSHELRSPLARLTVALELARDVAGDKAQEDLTRIGLEAERLNALIGEVLTLARFEQGAIKAATTELDLTSLLGDIAADARFEAEAAGKRVEIKTGEPCILRGDRLWLERALDNVLRNAVRHTAAGSAVEIGMHISDCRLKITVRDHGPGVPEDALAQIFEPFFRAEEARSRSTGGYGLGLAIAQRVIELHGGQVHASLPGDGGLSIIIELPLS